MKKKLLRVVVALPLLSLGWWMSSSHGVAPPSIPPTLDEMLRAHGGREAIANVNTFRAQAVRLTSTQPPAFFERRLTVAVEGEKFRRQTKTSIGPRLRSEWFDGQRGFQSLVSDDTEKLPEPLAMGGRRLQAVKSSLNIFGLLPILRRCAEPGTEIIPQDSGAAGLSKSRVKSSAGEWVVYTDQAHLIRQVEIGPWLLQFADYRSTGGLQLPFVQRLSKDRHLVCELIFSSIELNPNLPADYFTSAAPAQEAIR